MDSAGLLGILQGVGIAIGRMWAVFDVLCMEYSQQVNKKVGITPRWLFKPALCGGIIRK